MQNPSKRCITSSIHPSCQRSELHLQTHFLHLQVENRRIHISIEDYDIPLLLLGDGAPLVAVLQDDFLHDAQLLLTQRFAADARVGLQDFSREGYDLGLVFGVLQGQEGPCVVIIDLRDQDVLNAFVLQQRLQVGLPYVEQEMVRILLLEALIFAEIILILSIPALLLLMVPILVFFSIIFHDRGKVFLLFFILVLTTPVALLPSVWVRRTFLSIFNLLIFVIVLISSIIPLLATVTIMVVVIIIILIVVIEFVKRFSDLWFWTGMGMDWIIFAGRRLDFILEYLKHPLDLTDLQHFILSLEGEAFVTVPVLTDLEVRIDLILGTSLSYDLDNVQSGDVFFLFVLDWHVLDGALLTHIRQYFLHQSRDLHPEVLLGAFGEEEAVYVTLPTVGKLLDAKVDSSALSVQEATQSTFDLVAFGGDFSGTGLEGKAVVFVLNAQTLRLVHHLIFYE